MVTDKDIDGNTCLSLAVENGHYDVVKLCLEKSKLSCALIPNIRLSLFDCTVLL